MVLKVLLEKKAIVVNRGEHGEGGEKGIQGDTSGILKRIGPIIYQFSWRTRLW